MSRPSHVASGLSAERLAELDALIASRRLSASELHSFVRMNTTRRISESSMYRYIKARRATLTAVWLISSETTVVVAWAAGNTTGIALDLEGDPERPGELRPGPTLRALWAARTGAR